MALWTASARVPQSSLSRRRPTCISTVRGLKVDAMPISGLVRPPRSVQHVPFAPREPAVRDFGGGAPAEVALNRFAERGQIPGDARGQRACPKSWRAVR